MKLLTFLKKNLFLILAVSCILLIVINSVLERKNKKEPLVTGCDNTCSEVAEDRIDFSNFNNNIHKIINLMGRLKGHCNNRCPDNEETNQLASNDNGDSITI